VYWLIGLITAFITSFYMFRLLFMTFFGDYRGAPVDPHGHSSQAHGDGGHGHGEPHESPMVMLVPLMILAFLSVVGGLVGIEPLRTLPRTGVWFGRFGRTAGEAASHGANSC
jgi:NADH-quinone oxidoreductase subunit L